MYVFFVLGCAAAKIFTTHVCKSPWHLNRDKKSHIEEEGEEEKQKSQKAFGLFCIEVFVICKKKEQKILEQHFYGYLLAQQKGVYDITSINSPRSTSDGCKNLLPLSFEEDLCTSLSHFSYAKEVYLYPSANPLQQ